MLEVDMRCAKTSSEVNCEEKARNLEYKINQTNRTLKTWSDKNELEIQFYDCHHHGSKGK